MVSFATERHSEEVVAHPNIGSAERIATGALGAFLAADAIARPSGLRLLWGIIGGALIYRAASGYCPMYRKLGIDNAANRADQPGSIGADI